MADSINGRFPVIRTLDGQTWRDIGDNLPPALPGEAGFAASGTCAATCRQAPGVAGHGRDQHRARVLRTTDRGQTWRTSEVPLTVGRASRGGVLSVGFRDNRHGFAAGGDLAAADIGDNFARSRDGGRDLDQGHLGAHSRRDLRSGLRHRPRGRMGRRPLGLGPGTGARSGWGHHDDDGKVTVVATSPGLGGVPGALPGALTRATPGTSSRVSPGSGPWRFADEKTGWLVGFNGTITKIEF